MKTFIIGVLILAVLIVWAIMTGKLNSILPFLLILGCPLLHLLMMKGMHGKGKEKDSKDK